MNALRDRSRRPLLAGTLVALVVSGLALVALLGLPAGAATEQEPALGKRDALFWQQLVQNFRPARSLGLNSMADHEMLVLPGGLVLALHFDNLNLAKAKNLNWIALAVPGVFTKADQRRVNRLYGPGFTHVHNFEEDVHAGKPGMKGVWFVHVGARTFTSPFGKVRAGRVDLNFMPTKPPR
jgi:hypothetical protein